MSSPTAAHHLTPSAPSSGPGGSRPPRATRRRGPQVGRVITSGRRVTGTFVLLYVAPGERARPAFVVGEGARAAFVAGRKVGNAVKRNRARRVMREAWRGIAPSVRGAVELVWSARPGVTAAGMGAVRADMADVLARAGLGE